ncbi:MAG: amidohydrolase family protein [Acidobacteria bacterium]|nr:amidohydrolase family protein [Acidobacteriota bacterium]
MPKTESSAGTPWRLALPGWLAVCVLAVASLGCATRACWDCDVCASSLISVACVSAQEQTAARDVTWFEGARLIDGSGGAPIETSAFLVEDGVFAWVGRQGEREAPAGAARVDLPGKTVIPALIDAHQHIGLTNVKDGTHSKDNYTLANLVEHLERSAYHGVAATMSLGLEFDEALAFELRNEVFPGAARFLTSGRGIAATPMAGPQQEYRSGIPRGARTEAEGRAAVAELDGHGVDIIKIWVDDRGGTVPKLEPEVYRAIVDEAHARGMRVASHLGSTSGLADAKDLIRAGIDGFAHTVRDRDIDEEFMALVRANPDVWTIPNLPGSPVTLDDLPWLGETLPPFEIENLRAQAERLAEEGPGDFFELQCRNLARNSEAGMVIGMGTDSGVSVAWTTHTEIRDMADCGLTPMEALESATRINAEILGLDDLGTVTEGKSASFVVLDANPLDDISSTRRIDSVYLRGEPVDREALRARFMDGVR